MVKNPHGNAGDSRDDAGLVLGLGRSLGVRRDQVTCLSIFAWQIPWTEEPGGLWSTWWQKSQIQLGTQHIG